MKKVLCLLLFCIVTGCAAIKREIIIQGVDIATPKIEQTVPAAVENLLSTELAKTEFGVSLKDMRERMPMVYDVMKQGMGSLDAFFEQRIFFYYLLFESEVKGSLKKIDKSLDEFDVNSDGLITFNEYIRLYLALKEVDLSWRPSAHKYLTWYYLRLLFLRPSLNSISVYFTEDSK